MLSVEEHLENPFPFKQTSITEHGIIVDLFSNPDWNIWTVKQARYRRNGLIKTRGATTLHLVSLPFQKKKKSNQGGSGQPKKLNWTWIGPCSQYVLSTSMYVHMLAPLIYIYFSPILDFFHIIPFPHRNRFSFDRLHVWANPVWKYCGCDFLTDQDRVLTAWIVDVARQPWATDDTALN